MQALCPIPKILVPVDPSDESIRVAEYAACLALPHGDALEGITLIHVIGAGYITSHAGYIDLRVRRVEESEAFQRVRQMHYETDIFPMFDRAAETMAALGIPTEKIARIIRHGSEGKEIAACACEGGFSTIVLGRTTGEGKEDLTLGHIAQIIIQRSREMSVYVVGKRTLEDRACPIPRVLVAMDGSDNAIVALEHALRMIQATRGVAKVTLLCVEGAEPVDPEKVFERARPLVDDAGLPKRLVSYVSKRGVPGKEIASEAELGDYSTVVMGRRGTGGLKQLSLGSVSMAVLHRTVSPTIALVAP